MSNKSKLKDDCVVYPGRFTPSSNQNKIKKKILNSTSLIIKKPKVNLAESNEIIKIEMSIPGVNREDFQIEVENNKLSVFVYQDNMGNNNSESYKFKEFDCNKYARHLVLPKHADVFFISAEYHNGILKLIIPKSTESQIKHNHKIIVY